MKKVFTFLVAVLLTATVWAQSPEKISYQAVIRDASNNLVTNQAVGMQISILQGSSTGTAVYTETQTPTTNANGLVSIEIGDGTVVSGTFATIDWANGSYFIKTETDPAGGTNYTITGTSQLLSVPYALHAKAADSIIGGFIETDPVYGVSVASGITESDTAKWNNQIDKQSVIYFPQSGNIGSTFLISFSGNINTEFSQASPIAFQFGQATPIYPSQIRYINSKKIDVKLNIPWNAATGTYDIIINPNENEPNIIERAFLIDWFF